MVWPFKYTLLVKNKEVRHEKGFLLFFGLPSHVETMQYNGGDQLEMYAKGRSLDISVWFNNTQKTASLPILLEHRAFCRSAGGKTPLCILKSKFYSTYTVYYF